MNDETNISDVIHNLQQTVESLVQDTNTIRELSSLQHVMITPTTNTDTATTNNTSDINNNDNMFVSSIVAQMSSIDSVLTTLETKMKSLSSFIQDEKQAIRILNDKSNAMMEQYDIINDIFQVCFDRGNDDDDNNNNGDDLESSDVENFYDVNDFDDHEEIDIIVDDDHEEEVEMYNDHDKRRRRRSSGVHHDSLPNFDDDDDDNYLRKTTEELERLELEQNNKENPKNNTNMNDNHNDNKLHNNKLRDATNKWLLNNQQRQEGQKIINKNNKMNESSSVVDDAVLEVDDNDNLIQTPTIRSRRRSSFSTNNNNHPENDSNELQINKQYSNHQEQQQSVVIKLEPITKSEFENISKNTRGRMTLSTLNAALRDIQSCAQQKYNILSHHQNISPVSSGLSTPASYRQTLSTHEYYLSITELSSSSMKSNNNNTNTTPSKYSSSFQPYFISEQELRNDCLFFRKGESTARAILLTLRSAKRIKQVVGKKSQVCYVLL